MQSDNYKVSTCKLCFIFRVQFQYLTLFPRKRFVIGRAPAYLLISYIRTLIAKLKVIAKLKRKWRRSFDTSDWKPANLSISISTLAALSPPGLSNRFYSSSNVEDFAKVLADLFREEKQKGEIVELRDESESEVTTQWHDTPK